MCVLLTVTACLFKGEVKFEPGTWGGKILEKGNAKWIAFQITTCSVFMSNRL